MSFLSILEANIYSALAVDPTLVTAYRMATDGIMRKRNVPQGHGPQNLGNAPYIDIRVANADRDESAAGLNELRVTVEIEAVAQLQQRDPFLVASAMIQALKASPNLGMPGIVVNDWRHTTGIEDEDNYSIIRTTLSVRLIVPEEEE